MKIIHCFREPVGGLFRHVNDLARHQVQSGHQVGIICDSETGGEMGEKALKDLQPLMALGIKRLPMAREMRPSDIFTAFKIQKTLNAIAPDIIHAHGAKGGAYTRMFRWLSSTSRKAKLIYCAHGGSLHYDPLSLKGRIFFVIERLLEKLTDGLVFVCNYEKNTYVAKIGEPNIPYEIIYNGITPEEMEPVPAITQASDFVYVGAMRDLKGPDVIIEAMEQLIKAGKRLTITMVGDGPDKTRYMEMVKQKSLDGLMQFKAALPARQAFAMGRALILPSRAEAFPYIVLEAIGAKKPIFASNVGGVSEVFMEQADQLLPAADAQSLARAMQSFLDDDAPHISLTSLLHERVKTRFNLDVMATSVEAFYRRVQI